MDNATRNRHETEEDDGSATLALRQRQLFSEFAGMVQAICRRAGVREGDVDDVVQRVFLTVFSKLEIIHKGAARSFVAAVAKREAGHVRRSYRRRSEVPEEELAPRSSGAPRLDVHLHERRQLRCAALLLSEMEDVLRTVWLRHELLGLTCQEIAAADGAPLGTVKTRLRRARQLLTTPAHCGLDASRRAPPMKQGVSSSQKPIR